MADPWVLIQTGAAIVTALAAAGAFAYVRKGMRTLREHERVLFGEEAVDEWQGIVGMAQRNREQLRRNEELLSEIAEEDHDL